MNKKIIVTGGCGYIGSHTVVELITDNFDVVILDDLSNSFLETLDRIERITGIRPMFECIDLKNENATVTCFKKHHNIQGVIHFAAHKAVDESVKEPLMYYNNNLKCLLNVLEGMRENKIPNLIFSSSATVYGNRKQLPLSEDCQTQRPFSPYGNTKKIGEEILEDVSKNGEYKIISLRYFNPIGAHESGHLGELPKGIPNNLLPFITQTAIGKLEQLKVFGNNYPTNDGTPIRDYIHVVDVAKAHAQAIMRQLEGNQSEAFEVFNLGTGDGYSVMEIIKTFETVTGIPLNYKIVEPRPGDVPRLYADSKKANKVLGWKASRSLSTMIETSWKWEENFKSENTE